MYMKPKLSQVTLVCVCVCVRARPSTVVCGWFLHPLERVISPSWRVFTAVQRISSRGERVDERREITSQAVGGGRRASEKELQRFCAGHHVERVCGGTSERWRHITSCLWDQLRREESVGLKRYGPNTVIISFSHWKMMEPIPSVQQKY